MKFRWPTRKLASLPILAPSQSSRFVSTRFARFACAEAGVLRKFAVSSTAKDMLNIRVMAAPIRGAVKRVSAPKVLESAGLDNAWLTERCPDGIGSWLGCDRPRVKAPRAENASR